METSPLTPTLAARFEVQRVLASGGFGSVFLARQVELDRPVALKFLHADVLDDERQARRFIGEAQVTARIEHPNVVRVYAHGVEDAIPWIAYEYLPGRTLAEALEAGSVSLCAALRVAAQVAGALDAAHRQQVLHRDIKPANIMEAADGSWKVTDFGIARWVSATRTATQAGVVLGTPSHMAPETIRGDEPGPAADLYALGVTLFELITGEVPFRADSVIGVFTQHLSDPPPELGARAGIISTELESFLGQLLAKEPAARGTAAEAERRLEELAGLLAKLEEGSAERPAAGSTTQVRKPSKLTADVPRHPAAAAARAARRSSPSRESGATSSALVGAQPRPRPSRALTAGIALLLAVPAAALLNSLRPAPPPVRPPPVPQTPATVSAPAPLPDPAPCAGMIPVSEGWFRLGKDGTRDSSPQHQVWVDGFRIDRTEITNQQFSEFTRTAEYRAYLPPGASTSSARHSLPRHPAERS